MRHPWRLFFIWSAFLFGMMTELRAQTYVGAGYGTFNVPAAINRFSGFGPTLRFEHLLKDRRAGGYLDISYFKKSETGSEEQLYDNNGMPAGFAAITTTYSYLYSQLGFKVMLTKYPEDHKVNPYAGGGLAFVIAMQKRSLSPSYNVDDPHYYSKLYGFHCNAGVQFDLDPVMLDLRAIMDIILRPLVDGNSNIMTNIRLTAVVPIFKQ